MLFDALQALPHRTKEGKTRPLVQKERRVDVVLCGAPAASCCTDQP